MEVERPESHTFLGNLGKHTQVFDLTADDDTIGVTEFVPGAKDDHSALKANMDADDNRNSNLHESDSDSDNEWIRNLDNMPNQPQSF